MKRFLCGVLAVLLLVALCACGTQETATVRLSEVTHSVFYAPQYVALEQGFFADEGLKIELSNGGGADKVMTAVLTGQADIGLAGPEACIYVYNQGKDDHPIVFGQLTKRDGSFLVGREDVPFSWELLRGTTVTGDNYWKGAYDHANAVLMTETYQCPDPFALTEMEDVALAVAAERLGMLDRYIIIRDSVNMDVFMNGASPVSLWDPNFDESLASEESVEAADIFATAMENNFKVGKVVVDAILNGSL